MDSRENCGVCGEPLIYRNEEEKRCCDLCGREYPTLIVCPLGHYVCDACHSADTLALLRDAMDSTADADPFAVLERVMSYPSVPMSGPEHHAILPAVIVKTIENAGYQVPEGAVEKVIQRGAMVPGGWCGSHGTCGAGIGVGVAVSVLTEATPLKGPERGLANAATAYALARTVDDGPRCCKRMLRKGLEAAVGFLDERLGVTLPTTGPEPCRFVARNAECIRERCPYFPAR